MVVSNQNQKTAAAAAAGYFQNDLQEEESKEDSTHQDNNDQQLAMKNVNGIIDENKVIPIQENGENRKIQFSDKELQAQAVNFYNDYNEFNQNFQYSNDEDYYLLSMDWFNKWKAYVQYDYFNQNQVTALKTKEFGQEYPGVFNEDLLLSENDDLYQKYYITQQGFNDPTNIILKKDLQDSVDYILVSRKIMEEINENYYGKIIHRRALPQTDEQIYKKVEVNYKTVNFLVVSNEILKKIDLNQIQSFPQFYTQVSGYSNLKQFKSKIVPLLKQLFNSKKNDNNNSNYYSYMQINVEESLMRLWKLDNEYNQKTAFDYVKEICKKTPSYEYKIEIKGEFLDKKINERIEELNLSDSDILIIEFREEGKNWSFYQDGVGLLEKCGYCNKYVKLEYQCGCKKVNYCSEECQIKDQRYHQVQCDKVYEDEATIDFTEKPDSKKGLVGLNNLGNTCYMNSALQCLSNTEVLTQYFVNKIYVDDINLQNPLGSKGKLANKYASFIKNMWCENKDSYSPYALKQTISNLNQLFQGYQQHDQQELFSFLLDGLHEDLNKVLNKQLTETIESDNKPYYEIARMSWINYLKRNESIIVDNFYGQFKSRIVCPNEDCQKVAETFDPFSILPLPIPKDQTKFIDFHFLNLENRNKAYKIKISYQKNKDTIYDLKQKTGELIGVEPSSIRFLYMSYNNVNKNINDQDLVNTIKKQFKQLNLFAQEYSVEDLAIPQNELVEINVFMSKKEKLYYQTTKKKFTFARLFLFNKSTTLKDVHLKLFNFNRFLYEEFAPSQEEKEKIQQMSLQEAYDYIMNQDEGQNSLKNSDVKLQKSTRPYSVFIVHANRFQKCFMCNETNCETCELPEDDIPLEEFLEKITYLKSFNDFELEINWNNVPEKIDLSRLNSCQDLKNPQKVEENKVDNGVSLYDCLDLFQQPETLDEDNKWYCNKCKEHQKATKTIQTYKAPKVLVIQLKRFKHQQSHSFVSTGLIKTKVDFPIDDLDLTEHVINHQYTENYFKHNKNTIQGYDLQELEKNNEQVIPDKIEDQKLLYELYAVSNHIGSSLAGGHYTAYAKNFKSDKWYLFDDSRVYPVSDLSEMISPNAYLLFYIRKDFLNKIKEQ